MSKNKLLQPAEKEVFLIGVRHAVQWDGGINGRATKLKKEGYSDEFIEKDRESMKKMRDEMREICNAYNPDLVAEEGGPYQKNQGDMWKKNIGVRKILLEDQYKNKHMFVDAPLLNNKGVWENPSEEQRELEMASIIANQLQKKDVKKICLIVGGLHVNTLKRLLENFDIRVVVDNLLERGYIKIVNNLHKDEKNRIAFNNAVDAGNNIGKNNS